VAHEGRRRSVLAREPTHQRIELLEQSDERMHAAHGTRAVVVEVAELPLAL
jgi:hypothetical protein